MGILAPRVTALQTLLEACRTYAGLHDMIYNTMKTVCMLVRPKRSHGWYSTRVRLGNEELRFIEEYRYLAVYGLGELISSVKYKCLVHQKYKPQ